MTRVVLAVALGASVSLSVFPFPESSMAIAQDATAAPIEFVVTPGRSPLAVQRVGSAVTVIRGDEIQRRSQLTVADALRAVPGLEVYSTGGPGSGTSVRLRGIDDSRTLVLVDGVRVNDPSAVGGAFDFAAISPALIDRIEVLRGPQSAVYGSDAIGGVIAIFTKRGEAGPPRVNAQVEGGSYGTASGNVGISGADGAWRYAFGLNGQRSDGFSAHGYRVRRLEPITPPLRPDGHIRFGGFGRIGYDPGNGFRIDISALSSYAEAEYDGRGVDAPNTAFRRLNQVSARAELDTFERRLVHSFEVFASRNERRFVEGSWGPGGARRITSRSGYLGDRYGAEYQARLRLDQFGSLILGARTEQEDATVTGLYPLKGRQATHSAFALWQVPVTERLDVSLGGRFDKVSDAGNFATWRATAAYRIPQSLTTLRASVGTGAKAPTLFQRFSPGFGNPNLQSERSFGIDAGFDQMLFAGRANLSVTGFYNRLSNLVAFQNSRYVNVAKAETSGVEAAIEAEVFDPWLRARLSYTYLEARDLATSRPLVGRPRHSGRFSLIVTPTSQWTIEPSVTFVSERFQSPTTKPLAPWARVDVYASYRARPGLELYARAENLTDARYEETRNYGTAGRSIYVGLKAAW
jgi:vitamin B12 transporter